MTVFAPLSLADGVTKERLSNGKIITIYSDDPDVIAARIRKEETKIGETNEAWATLREIAAERVAVNANRGTADSKEGMMSFMQKRNPVFNQS